MTSVLGGTNDPRTYEPSSGLQRTLGQLLCRLGRHSWRHHRINRHCVTPGVPFVEFGWVERWRTCRRHCPARQRNTIWGWR